MTKFSKKQIVILFCAVLAVLLLPKISLAANYYVDFQSGSDSNNGISASTPWKHSPGDGNATGIPASKTLQAGDIVKFKGDVVYRGSIRIDGRFVNGALGNPIVLKGDDWGPSKAILDGAVEITGSWQRCPSLTACSNNPNWQNIYYTDLSGTYTFQTGFYENDEFLWYSQDPNPTDPFHYDRTEYLRVIPKGSTTIYQTRTSITDPRYFNQGDANFWNGAYIIAWRVPNVTVIKKITSFDPATHTIYHEDLGGDLYTDRDSYYSVLNHVSLIDTAGEFSFDEINHRLYVWPRQNNITLHSYGVRALGTGIFASSAKNITIEGFIIQRFVFGIRAIDSGSGIAAENVIIRNNEVRKLKSNDWYAIEVGGKNIVVEDNKVLDCQRAVGIRGGGENITFQRNFVSRASRQGIWFMGAKNSIIANNTVQDCRGTHANGISVYLNSENAIISGNTVLRSNIPFTMESSNGLNIYNNLFDGGEMAGYLIAGWGRLTGTINIFNNTIVGSSNNASVYIRDCDSTNKVFLRNNILDGGGCGTRSHNIYTALAWSQIPRYGWSLAEGETIENDLTKIFVNPTSGDYRLKMGSPAINTGTNTGVTADILGISRPQGIAWDIGAYEYVSVPPPDTTPPAAPTGVTVR
jgi:hypothetical protein